MAIYGFGGYSRKGTSMKISAKQKGVLAGISTGFMATSLLIGAGILLNPFHYPADTSNVEGLAVAMRCCALLAVFVALSVGRLAKQRFFNPEDIDGGGLSEGSAQAQVLQSVLQNTVEQTLLAVLVYMAWAATMPGEWLSVLPLAAISFAIGRLLFFAGYRRGAPSRALGFALTFYPSVGMLLVIVGRQLWLLL